MFIIYRSLRLFCIKVYRDFSCTTEVSKLLCCLGLLLLLQNDLRALVVTVQYLKQLTYYTHVHILHSSYCRGLFYPSMSPDCRWAERGKVRADPYSILPCTQTYRYTTHNKCEYTIIIHFIIHLSTGQVRHHPWS